MQSKNQISTGLAGEFKIIPRWAWILAALAFIIAQLFFNVIVLNFGKDAPAFWARPLLGTMAGLVLGCYLLFIGYASRDTRRRGMNPVLWILVIVCIPNGLGIILYFILRQRLLAVPFPNGGVAPPGIIACTHCACTLSFCPSCGNPLR